MDTYIYWAEGEGRVYEAYEQTELLEALPATGYFYILGGGRWSEGEGRVYEAYEVNNQRQKLRCLLLRR
jgi:hypothetical protein